MGDLRRWREGVCLFLRRAKRSDSHSGLFSTEHIHLCEKGRPLNSDERPWVSCAATGRQTVHGLQHKHNMSPVTDGGGGVSKTLSFFSYSDTCMILLPMHRRGYIKSN